MKRFVITEFFRTPSLKAENISIWYHKNTIILKRELIFDNDGFFTDSFYDSAGKLHRENDEPAMICSNGDKQYYFHGKLHRSQFEPAVEKANGILEYWVYGEMRFRVGRTLSYYEQVKTFGHPIYKGWQKNELGQQPQF